eukprot:1178974-Prorocentrum_minimum.AAC.2
MLESNGCHSRSRAHLFAPTGTQAGVRGSYKWGVRGAAWARICYSDAQTEELYNLIRRRRLGKLTRSTWIVTHQTGPSLPKLDNCTDWPNPKT